MIKCPKCGAVNPKTDWSIGDFHDYENEMDAFTLSYIEGLLWSSQQDTPDDNLLVFKNLSESTLNQIVADCKKFQEKNSKDLCIGISRNAQEGGHCFALSRNHHGTGFFDSEYFSNDTRQRLQEAAMKFGEFNIYLGDDRKIYH
jgi:hypothetical protein